MLHVFQTSFHVMNLRYDLKFIFLFFTGFICESKNTLSLWRLKDDLIQAYNDATGYLKVGIKLSCC